MKSEALVFTEVQNFGLIETCGMLFERFMHIINSQHIISTIFLNLQYSLSAIFTLTLDHAIPTFNDPD